MIAPEPFFEPRGTPFSEYHRIRALLDLGHTVDLVTYPFGNDVQLPGLRIYRDGIPIGFAEIEARELKAGDIVVEIRPTEPSEGKA